MDLVVDFVVENYIWFIAGIIFLLMVIIGFIAEKTDFGKKPFGSKKVADKEESENLKTEEVTNNGDVNYNVPAELSLDQALGVNDVSSETLANDISDNVPEFVEEDVVDAPIEEVETSYDSQEDLNTTFGDQDVAQSVEEEAVTIPEEETVDNPEEEIVTNPEEETAAEDDVWKF